MEKKQNLKFILAIVLLSTLISFSLELFFNRNVLLKNNLYKAKVIEKKDVKKNGKWYQTTSKEAYILLELKESWVNKVQFNYQSSQDFLWKLEYNSEGIENTSSSLIHKSVRKVGKNIDSHQIKISFYNKNLKIGDFAVNNKIYINYSRMLVIFLSLFGIFIIIKYRKYFLNHLEKAFLFIVLTTGCLLIITTPKNVYTSWDDHIHLKNSYVFLNSDVSKFSSALKIENTHHKIEDSFFTTQEERNELYHSLNQIHKKTRNHQIQINNYSNKYNKLVYLPFYLGFKVADICHMNYILSFIMAKLLNFLCYVLLMFLAIKISTYAKKLIFFISLLASNLFLATQFSYDPMITASITLGLAFFLRLLEDEKMNKKYLFLFICCIIWASLPKAIYCPLLLLILFIPNSKFDNKKQAIVFKIITTLIMLLLMSTFILPFFMGEVAGDIRGGNTNASEQLRLILQNPFGYGKTLLKFFIKNGQSLLIGEKTFISFAYLDSYISPFISFIYISNLIFLLYLLFSDSFSKKVISNKIKIVFSVIYMGISVLIATAMYLSFTEVGIKDIAGVQTRYFIPLLLILLFIMAPTKNKIKKEKKSDPILLLLLPYCTLMLANFIMVYKAVGI